MEDEIEVKIESGNEGKNETPVSFTESGDSTIVHVGEDKPSGGREGARDPAEQDRWNRAEADRLTLRADLADIRARLAGGSNGTHQAPAQPDHWKSQEDQITEQEKALGIQFEAHRAAKTLTQDMLKDFDARARGFQQARINLATQRAIQESLPSVIAATQQQQYAREYGDVQANPHANRWARGYYDQLVAQGEPDSPSTVAKAMNAARAQFRIGNYRMEPTDRDRSQMTGFGGSNRRSPEPGNKVTMGKAEKIMAMAMYGDAFNGDEKKAYATWAKGPGLRGMKEARKRDRGGRFA